MSEYTEVVNGVENVVTRVLKNIADTKQWICICGDSNLPTAHVLSKPIFDAMIGAKGRGVRIRFITQVTKDNISDCRENMKFAELRHLDGVKGSFGVSEFVYQATTTVPDKEIIPQLIISTSKAIVDQANAIFEMLWEKAIPASLRIRQIEEGREPELLEIINDSHKSIERAFRIMDKTTNELLVLFATARTFSLAMTTDAAQVYKRISERGASVRILVPDGGSVHETIKYVKQVAPLVNIRVSGSDLNTSITVMVSDSKEFMSWPLRDDRVEDVYQAAEIATYSNIPSLASSYSIIFEKLWLVTEFAEQLRTANAKLENNEEAMREFINIAAHELRTPIQPILGLSETLRETSPYPDQYEFLDAIMRNAKRLHRLAEEILQVSRIESGLLKINYEEFDLVQLIHELLSDVRSQNKKNLHNKGLKFYAGTKKIMICGDKSKLGELTGNLINNAVKFTPKGLITIEAEQAGNEVTVSVQDSGQGIDPDIMPHLFTKFASKSSGGTGLGLYICKKIAEAHGGKIWAESNSGKRGTTFRFCIPAKAGRI